MNRLLLATLPLGSLVACMASKGDLAPANETGWTKPPDTSSDIPADSGDDGEEQPPAWYTVAATATLTGGQPSTEGATMVFRLYPEDGPGDDALCETAATAPVLTPLEIPTDSGLLAWWEVTVPATDGACDLLWTAFPTTVQLGIGPMHPDIAAVLASAGYGGLADSLYGAYVSVDGGLTLWVQGVAGVEASYAGEAVRDEDGPLPDGTWRLEPLYALPLE